MRCLMMPLAVHISFSVACSNLFRVQQNYCKILSLHITILLFSYSHTIKHLESYLLEKCGFCHTNAGS